MDETKSTDNQVPDFSEEFAEQRKRFQPWAIVLLIWFGLFIFSPPIFVLFGIDLSIYAKALPIMLLLLLPLGIKMYLASQCPNCGKYMGRNLNPFCKKCGVRLRHLTEENTQK